MVVGFNHNFRYQGETYHIQTEDSGRQNPHIITLLYHGGTILASKKTSYADITKVDNLERIVEELMKEQHKSMLRSLKAGEFDQEIKVFWARKTVGGTTAVTPPPAPSPENSTPPTEAHKPESPGRPEQERPPAVDVSLDDAILSYLFEEDK